MYSRQWNVNLLFMLALWPPLSFSFQPSAPTRKCIWNLRDVNEHHTCRRQGRKPLANPNRRALFLSKRATTIESLEKPTSEIESIESFTDAAFDTDDIITTDTESSASSNDYVKIMMVLLWGTAFLSALDRVAMSVAVLPLAQEFGFSDATKGSISAFFSVGYGLAIVPAGIIVGSTSPRILLGAGLVAWSLATIATPIAASTAAVSLAPLLASRAMVGSAESVILPAIQRLLSSWISPSQKGTALATIFTGFQSGTVAAYLLSPFVMDALSGWRGLFFTYGAIGLLWFVPWLLLSKDAPPSIQQEQSLEQPEQELELSISESFQEALKSMKEVPWRDFAQSPAVWAMTLAHAANNWGLYNNLAWTPTFFAEQYGLNVKDSALLSILPSVAGAVGGLIAGSSADAILSSVGDESEEMRTRIRKIYQGIALFGPALCLATLSAWVPEHPWVAQTLLMGTVGLQAFNAAGYQAANQEKAGDKWTGLLYSITSLPGVMVGSFAVYLTGQVLDATGQDWSIVFSLNAMVNVLGASAFVLFYNSKREFD